MEAEILNVILQVSLLVFVVSSMLAMGLSLTVPQIAEVRNALRPNDAQMAIYKNTLAKLAVRDAGIEGIEDLLVGPTALTFVKGDVAGAAKALRDSAKTLPALVVKGGVLSGAPLWAQFVVLLVLFPMALWIMGGVSVIVRLLSYLDSRIRLEGWEVELAIRAEAMRQFGEEAGLIATDGGVGQPAAEPQIVGDILPAIEVDASGQEART